MTELILFSWPFRVISRLGAHITELQIMYIFSENKPGIWHILGFKKIDDPAFFRHSDSASLRRCRDRK